MRALSKSNDRGRTSTDWLDSRHSFSFGYWRAPERMGFRRLRVLNEDRVAPGAGFGPHPHRDMEILTFVLDGELEHRDSSGARSLLRAGDVAHMSAGSGVVHSEWNGSETEPVHFLQVWLEPDRLALAPSHEVLGAERFVEGDDASRLRLVAGPSGDASALPLHADALVHWGRVQAGRPVHVPIAEGRGVWVQVLRGGVVVNGVPLSAGDGLALEEESTVVVSGDPEGELLLFDLA